MPQQTFSEGAETFVFKHALVQEGAYKSLLRAARQRHHERIASVLLSDFKAEVEHRPEVVARHLSGAGHYAEASDHWLAAGLNALPRMAIPEAHAHFARALEDLKRLPPSPAVLAKELDLQIAIAPTLMTVNGWGSPTVAEACKRARDLAIELNRPDKMYPPIWGIWTNLFLRGEMDEAAVAARAALEMAEASGLAMIRITGRHASAYTHLYRGEFEETVGEADAGLALVRSGAGAGARRYLPVFLLRGAAHRARDGPVDAGPARRGRTGAGANDRARTRAGPYADIGRGTCVSAAHRSLPWMALAGRG